MNSFPFQVIDLTHPIQTDMPLWPGDPQPSRKVHARHDSDKYALNTWTIGEHTGTHVGAPGHRVHGGHLMDRIPVEDLVLPCWVIEASKSLTVSDLERYEREYSRIKPGSCVALATGWAARWPDPKLVFERGANGRFLWPGFSAEAVDWLHQERRVKALATDAPDLGQGADKELLVGLRCAELGMLHVENLENLDQMPSAGGYVVIGTLPLIGGTGSPARVFGLTLL